MVQYFDPDEGARVRNPCRHDHKFLPLALVFLGLLAAFVQAGLAASNGEVRRQVRGKAIRINDEIVEDETMKLTADRLNDDGMIKLSVGRKRHALLKVAAD